MFRVSSLSRFLNPYAEILRNRTYLPLWLGQLVSNLGDTLNYVAVVVLVYRLSGSGLAVSTVVVFEILPVLLIAPVAGVVIDRFPRKRILIGADIARALLMLGLIAATETWHVYLAAALLTTATVFFNPTVQAVIPAIVPEDALLAANSVSWSTGRLVQIVGAALAGGLIAAVGTDAAFAFNGLTFLFSALMVVRLRIPAHAGKLGRGSSRGVRGYLADAKAGLAFARADPFVSRFLVVQALASLAVGATGALLIVLSERHLGLPPAGFAWLLLAIGVGALLGPFLLGAVTQEYRDAKLLFVPYLIRGAGDILLAVVTPLPVALVILFVYGLNTSTGMVVSTSLLQSQVPESVRGRVYTLLDVTWNLMRLVSLALGGVLVDAVGIRVVYALGGGLLVVAGLVGLGLFRRVRFR
jgi:MFS family permease